VPSSSSTRSPSWSFENLGPTGTPSSSARSLEPALAVVLDERVTHRRAAVVDVERADLVALPVQRGVPGRDRLDGDGVARIGVDDAREFANLAAGPPRGVDGQGRLAVVEVPRLQQPRQPQHVVAMEVRDEHVRDGEAGPVAHHLALGALADVEQQTVALPVDHDGAGVALGRRDGAPGPQERHAQRHDPTVGGRTVYALRCGRRPSDGSARSASVTRFRAAGPRHPVRRSGNESNGRRPSSHRDRSALFTRPATPETVPNGRGLNVRDR